VWRESLVWRATLGFGTRPTTAANARELRTRIAAIAIPTESIKDGRYVNGPRVIGQPKSNQRRLGEPAFELGSHSDSGTYADCQPILAILGGMSKESSSHGDRYDTRGNPEAEYVDGARTVLVNKLGIMSLGVLQEAEEEGLATAYRSLLKEVRADTPLTCEVIRNAHWLIFSDLYEWAGKWRTVWISKPGATWPPPDFLEASMREYEKSVLLRHAASALADDDEFCRGAAEIQGEFLVIHPFREGNARTIKLITDLLAAQTQRPLLRYDASREGRDAYVLAARAAFKRDYARFEAIIRQALAEAR
jgi:cell filamentation protein